MPHLLTHCDAEQGSPEWLEARLAGVGSTDSSAIMGLNKYKTPRDVYREKIGEGEPFTGNWFTERGKAMEPVLRQHYSDTFNEQVLNVNGTLKHPEHPFLLASLDGYTLDNRLCEFKTASTRRGWGEEGTDEVPPDYLIQVQHAMLVAGFEEAIIGVSFSGMEPNYYNIPADKTLQTMILDKASAFWDKVQARIEPEPVSIKEMEKEYRITDGHPVYINEHYAHIYAALILKKDEVSLAKAELENIEDEMKRYLLEAGGDTLLDEVGKTLITWRETAGRKTLDTKRLKEQMPDIYEQFVKQGNPSRRFLVKGV